MKTRPSVLALASLFLAACTPVAYVTSTSQSAPLTPSSSSPSSSSSASESSSIPSSEPSSEPSSTPSSASSSSEQTSASSSQKTRKYERLNTKTIEGMPDDFIYGMDVSAVPSLEASGVKYRDEYGDEKDVFAILADNGVNYIRVRIWNDPYNSETRKGYGGGNCDVNNAIAIGKRATANGMKLLVDFHYSDFWADPQKQNAPKTWKNYTLAQKESALFSFTKDTLNALKREQVDVGMVQVGNEINNFHMCGETEATNTIALLKKGSQAVREVYPGAMVAVHFTNPEKGRYPNVAATLASNNLDYDVFGTSYYPYWHGTLANLSSTLSTVATSYNKKTMVLETSYLWTEKTFDIFGNTEPKEGDTFPHEISMQGQYDQVQDVIETIGKNTTGGIGVCYWEGTWVGVNGGTGTWEENQALWDRYGSGWACLAAKEYDKEVWQTEGSAVDNETFFDEKGVLLPSIEAFHHEKAEPSPTPDPEKSELLTNGSFELGTEPWQVESLTEGVTGFQTFAAEEDQWATFVEGNKGLHIWDPSPIHAKIYQRVENVAAGTHTFKISMMGSCEGATVRPYVLTSSGKTVLGDALALNGYNVWDEQSCEFTLNASETVLVGVDVDFVSGDGWAWFDGASLK